MFDLVDYLDFQLQAVIDSNKEPTSVLLRSDNVREVLCNFFFIDVTDPIFL